MTSELQTHKMSLLESIANVFGGYLIAVGSQVLIFPLFNIHIPLKDNFLIGLWFMGISLARSYIIRRFFNGL